MILGGLTKSRALRPIRLYRLASTVFQDLALPYSANIGIVAS